ncbi:MAG: hypothetical protein LQ352_008400 [Teloschistes flavicans]|nr:MAG: hypothetical protein LQ352_008400 [Teloschistes flavicans]
MTSITLNDKTTSSPLHPNDTAIFAALDSGASTSLLPRPIAEAIYSAAGVLDDAATQNYPAVSCNLSTAAATFTFGFGGPNGPQISVSMAEFVAPWQNNITFADGTPACSFNLRPVDTPDAVLGDSFLRSAYAVFDLDQGVVALAQSNTDPATNNQPNNITAIHKGNNTVLWGEVLPLLDWPPAYIDAYRNYAAQSSTTTATTTPSNNTSSINSTSPSPTTANFRITALPPSASFTAEGPANLGSAGTSLVTPTPAAGNGTAPTIGQPPVVVAPSAGAGANGTSAPASEGVMDVRVTAGVVCLGVTVGMAAVVMEVFAA